MRDINPIESVPHWNKTKKKTSSQIIKSANLDWKKYMLKDFLFKCYYFSIFEIQWKLQNTVF